MLNAHGCKGRRKQNHKTPRTPYSTHAQPLDFVVGRSVQEKAKTLEPAPVNRNATQPRNYSSSSVQHQSLRDPSPLHNSYATPPPCTTGVTLQHTMELRLDQTNRHTHRTKHRGSCPLKYNLDVQHPPAIVFQPKSGYFVFAGIGDKADFI